MNRASRRRLLWVLALVLLAIAAVVTLLLPAPGQGIAAGPAAPRYVGSRNCEECHAEEARQARGSHHQLAMQKPSPEAVLGRFDDGRVSEAGVTLRFLQKGEDYLVRVEGRPGGPAEYRVAYTIGVSPLQQYAVEAPGGRYQVLDLAWDSRARRRGGQRWVSFRAGEHATHPGGPHWAHREQNWNSECAECHSTNLTKGYRPADDRFLTTFSEAGVSCEACHGPGSRHAEWAQSARARGRQPSGDPGLVVRYAKRGTRVWEMDLARGTARAVAAPGAAAEIETCARCHARRELLSEDYQPGRPLSETHRPALLEDGLYYPDGQVREEVYEWGAFLQSRMHAAGVACSDCHDAHDQQVRGGADQVCASCHQAERFAVRKHHFHRENGKGASCIACHMRRIRFGAVEARHDHSLRVPRPDLTVKLGAERSPNACNDCHADRSPGWAQRAVRRWFPEGRTGTPHYAEALGAAWSRAPGAERALLGVARDLKLPGIVRGTAISLLTARRSPASLAAIQKAAGDPNPLVRLGAASALPSLPPAERLRAGVSLLWDDARAVRVEAVAAFADVPDAELASEQRAAFDHALDEYLQAQRANAERPEARVRAGFVLARRGLFDEARRAYDDALRIAPGFAPAHLELADLLRMQGRDGEGEAVLRKALRLDPSDASVHHALGRLLARRRSPAEALSQLGRAWELAPADPRFAQDYADGLLASGRADEAIRVLRESLRFSPGAADLLASLCVMYRDRGEEREARRWADRLLAAAPDDPEVQDLVEGLALEAGTTGP